MLFLNSSAKVHDHLEIVFPSLIFASFSFMYGLWREKDKSNHLHGWLLLSLRLYFRIIQVIA